MRLFRYIYILVFVVWTGVSAYAFPQTKQTSAWTTTPQTNKDVRPSYQFRSTSTYTSVVGDKNIFFTSKQEDNTPAIIGNIPYPSMAYTTSGSRPLYAGPKRAYRGGGMDDEEDDDDPWGDPMGSVDTPVGEPWVLLLMALVFLIAKNGRFRCKNAQKE